MIAWPAPDPVLPEAVDPVLADATRAAAVAFRPARERSDRVERVSDRHGTQEDA